MSGWSCKFEANGTCLRVDGAYCRPGMKGCILQGQVTFHDGIEPSPQWPKGHRRHRPGGPAEEDLPAQALPPED